LLKDKFTVAIPIEVEKIVKEFSGQIMTDTMDFDEPEEAS
jgi:hypothetical protein